MFKSIGLLLALTFSTFATAKPQQIIPPVTEQAKSFFTIEQHDISVDSQRNYRIFIAVPRQSAPKEGYPVLYMLDGNAQFPLAVNGYSPDSGPAPLIVAIGYQSELAYITEKRTRDYTPYSPDPEFSQGGKSEAFFQFIEQRLKPWAESKYHIDPKHQTLAGHSFGGLFTLYALFNHPDSFQRYVAASPSIWWGNGIVIPKRSPLIDRPPQSVTITVGEYEESPDPTTSAKPIDPERAKLLAKRRQVTNARTLAQQLTEQHANVSFIVFPAKNHGGVIPDAVNLAVLTAGRRNSG